jgi:hypothetical protein
MLKKLNMNIRIFNPISSHFPRALDQIDSTSMVRNWKRSERGRERAGWKESMLEIIEVDTVPTEMTLLTWMGRCWALELKP